MAYLETIFHKFMQKPDLRIILALWAVLFVFLGFISLSLWQNNQHLTKQIEQTEADILDYHLYHVQIKAIEDDLKSSGHSYESKNPLTQLEVISQQTGLFRKMESVQPIQITLEDGQQFQAYRLSFSGVSVRDFMSFLHSITFKSVLKPHKIELNKIGSDYLNAQITLLGEAES